MDGHTLNRLLMGKRFPEDWLDRQMADTRRPFEPTPEQWEAAQRMSEQTVGTGLYMSPETILRAMEEAASLGRNRDRNEGE